MQSIMEGSSHFSVPHPDSDASTFKPITELPDHLDQYAKISSDLRHKMTPVMKAILELTDKTVLRCAALPQSN
jgi:hypothetical protein